MIIYSRHIVFLVFALVQVVSIAQKRPVTVSSAIVPPYTVNLQDYADKWKVSFTFGDLNEAGWDVAIRVKISSDKFTAQTDPNFASTIPVRLIAGIPRQLTYQELTEVLSPQNLLVSGFGAELFRQQGRLPEGFYTFCIEAIDYTSGVTISHSVCSSTWILLNDPPRVISPLCGDYVSPANPQNFLFSWQLATTTPSLMMGAEYQLTIQEVIDKTEDPRSAINNSNAFPIFRSPWQESSSFHYGVDEPWLDVGKMYVYQIQARDRVGRDSYKNDGLSEVCWFYYGYPEGAFIQLTVPDNKHHFRFYDRQRFSWEAPNIRVKGQPFRYAMEVVEILLGQDSASAIEQNEAWYSMETSDAYSLTGYSFELKEKKFVPMQWYAWRVQTYSGKQLVASSDIRTFQGPPVVENFYARDHLVQVISTENSDINNLSGTGRVSIGHGDTVEVSFKNIKLKDGWDRHILIQGDVFYTFEKPLKKELKPNERETLAANLALTKLRLNKDGLYIQGIIEYPLLHATSSPGAAYVRSDSSWFHYDSYVLSGRADVAKNQVYDLLDPYDFQLSMDTISYFLIDKGSYWASFYGDIFLPETRKSTRKKRVSFRFEDLPQLIYFEQLPINGAASWKFMDKTTMEMSIEVCTIDLSEEKSPALITDPLWKGAYFDRARIISTQYVDERGQITLDRDLSQLITLSASGKNKNWLDAGGLQLYTEFNAGKGRFNQFPTVFDKITLDIKNDAVQNSTVVGKITIPVLSETEKFTYTVPVNNQGFSIGYLNKQLDGRDFVFNKEGGEQRINIHVDRAVFANQSKLVMMVDLEWKSAGVKMSNVAGFSIWGADYNIGFAETNGAVSLTRQVKGEVSGYPITLDHVGAGRDGGLYSIGSTGQIVMGEGFTGPDGPTEVNFYSVGENSLLDESINFRSSSSISTGGDQAFSQQAIQLKADQKFGMAFSNNGKAISFGESFQTNLQMVGGADLNLNEFLNADLSVGGFDLSTGELSLPDFSLQALQVLMTELKVYLPDEKQQEAAEVIAYLPKLDVKYQMRVFEELIDLKQLAYSMLKSELDGMLVQLTAPLEALIADIQGQINGQIDATLKQGYDFLDVQLRLLIDGLANEAVSLARSQGFEVSSEINTIKTSIHSAVFNELKASLDLAIRQNLLAPFDVVLKDNMIRKIRLKLSEDLMNVGFGVLDPKASGPKLDGVLNGFGDVFEEMGAELLVQFTPDNLKGMVEGVATTLIAELDVNSIFQQIANDLISVAGKAIVEKYLQENIDVITSELGKDVLGNLAANVSLDFSNLEEKLKNGRIDQIIKFDPTNIKIKSSIADIQGTIKFEADDPQYGDVWIGELKAFVKIMPNFSCGAKFMNGRKDDYAFWFFSLEVRDLNLPMAPLPFLFDGANGKVYHHMQARGEVITLNRGVSFGAGITMFFKDAPMTGGIVDFNVGVSLEFLEGGVYMGMLGDVNVGNFGGFSLMNGRGEISYNSKEEHFLANFSVKSNTEALGILCVGGGLDIEVRPNHWHFAIGTREDPIFVEPLCSPVPGMRGWFELNKKKLDVGLYVRSGIHAKVPFWINLGIVKVKPYAGFELMAGAEVVVNWSPLALRYASLEAGLTAYIGVEWRTPRICVWGLCTPSASGDLTIAGVWLHGKLAVGMEDKFRMTGQLDGRVVFWDIGFDFDLRVDATI